MLWINISLRNVGPDVHPKRRFTAPAPRLTPSLARLPKRRRTTRDCWSWLPKTPPRTPPEDGATSSSNHRPWHCAISRRRFASIRKTGMLTMAGVIFWPRRGRRQEAVHDAEQRSVTALVEPLRSITPPAPLPSWVREKSEKTNEDRQERAVGVQYQDRALQLLREALEALPAEQRRSFWKRNIERDAALNFVRRSAEFQRLARTYATPAATTGPLD